MTKVFIDGSAGTTGLRIYERLNDRKDLTLISLSDELRKDPSARKNAINEADIVYLCLPDAAAVESVSFIENDRTRVIDTSTAHRVNPSWTYGFAEIGKRKDEIKSAKRVANPGCHASGFIALIAPLVEMGAIAPDTSLTCFSLTGYSGGGKKMIAEYESEERDILLSGPRQYGLTQKHKHLPEMAKISGLTVDPVFCPIVAPYYAGMEVTVPVFKKDLLVSAERVRCILKEYYADGLVRYVSDGDETGFISASKYAGRDDMEVSVYGNDDRILLVSRFDNLGKGASGAAIQNMNIMLSMDERTGLNV